MSSIRAPNESWNIPALPTQPNFGVQIFLPMSLSRVKMDDQVEMY